MERSLPHRWISAGGGDGSGSQMCELCDVASWDGARAQLGALLHPVVEEGFCMVGVHCSSQKLQEQLSKTRKLRCKGLHTW